MMTGFMGFSILQAFRCRILSLPNLPIIPFGSFWLENFHQLRTTFKRDSKSKFIGSNNFEASWGSFSRAWISQPITPRIVEKDNDKDTGSSKSSHPWHESLEASLRARSISESSFSEFRRIQYFDAEQRIKEIQDLKHPVKRFVIEVETTGFCRETGWIIAGLLKLLSWIFQGTRTVISKPSVKPEQHVPNSFLHGITTQMVNEPNVPRYVIF